jgi:hypothetical protein
MESCKFGKQQFFWKLIQAPTSNPKYSSPAYVPAITVKLQKLGEPKDFSCEDFSEKDFK